MAKGISTSKQIKNNFSCMTIQWHCLIRKPSYYDTPLHIIFLRNELMITGWVADYDKCENQNRTYTIEQNERAIYREKPLQTHTNTHTIVSVWRISNWTTRHITSGCWSVDTVTIIFGVYNRAMSGISLTGEFLKPPPQTDVDNDLLTLVNLQALCNIV